MRVYLDNAATTPLDEEVFEAMKPYMLEYYGNPSSIHTHGNQVKSGLEKARKKVADLLNAAPAEIFFTSGGTEADNTAIRCTIDTYGIKHAITSRIEHHAVLHTLQAVEKEGKVKLHYVSLDERGHIDMDSLRSLLEKAGEKCFVSLMHGNNEIGNLTDIASVSGLCKEFGAVYHSDTVQTMGHYRHDLQALDCCSIVGSAHKFHGPKGVGFLYVSANHKIHPLITGGAQERNMRGGTENVYGIIGLAKALEIAYRDMDDHQAHIQGLKDYMIDRLKTEIPEVGFHGDSANASRSLYTVLNVSVPNVEDNAMLLFNLNIQQISASGGSACSSGSSIGSHVLAEVVKNKENRGAIRFSFSKRNTKEELDYVVNKLSETVKVSV
ncbi:cysteine desulfurase family protein [Roseivirga sp. BDSF3-8]|uniref:cysteine desulfurase family protein n=1 Tax=Roseivirga sp. BDSF3-8 TaxID=3241598 RepID=UPI00353206AE